MSSDIIVFINESVNLRIQRCGSIIARGTLHMVLWWLRETYAVATLTSLYIF